jgi:ribosomal protein S18 acetylase RimI-like enzyme
MGELPLILRRASEQDFEEVRSLLTEASQWLRYQGTSQWAAPWPDENGRNENIRRAIGAGRTWLLWDEDQPAATLTASPNDHQIWPEQHRHERAVYVRRLTVSRRYSGVGLGGQLLDWAGLRASRQYRARWIRVDVWTDNIRLHRYYIGQGFARSGTSPIEGYPSSALFQKPVDQILFPAAPLFREDPDAANPAELPAPARGPARHRAWLRVRS